MSTLPRSTFLATAATSQRTPMLDNATRAARPALTTTFLLIVTVIAALVLQPRPAAADCSDGTVKDTTTLFHGSPVSPGGFSWRGGLPKPPTAHSKKPDGPAWFAVDDEFSIHAGLRLTIAGRDSHLYVHSYKPQDGGVSLRGCATWDEMADAIKKMDSSADVSTDVSMATAFCKVQRSAFQYNGYFILKDRVRGQLEIILCEPDSVLTYEGTDVWDVVHDGKTHIVGQYVGQTLARAYSLDESSLTSFKKLN